jgi:hypothetical protein
MTEPQTAYQRMLDWGQGITATEQTIVPGKRTIQHRPTAPAPEDRWEGQVDHPDYREMRWRGPHVEAVIKRMDTAIGARPESEYTVLE